MARPVPVGEPATFLRDVLHPDASGIPAVWRSRLEAGTLLAQCAADPALVRCVPVVAARLREISWLGHLPPSEWALAEVTLEQSAQRVAAMRAILVPLGEACARERIRCFLCKGAALHGLLYADPSARPAGDADLLASASDVVRLLAVLERVGLVADEGSAARIDAFGRGGHRDPTLIDLVFAAPGLSIVVEVKADPVGVGPPIRRLTALTDGGTPSPCYPGLLVPSAETMAIQQTFSLARRPSPDLLAHAELAGVLHARRAELVPERLLDLLAGEGLYGILRAVLADTEALFPGTVPSALRRPSPARPAGAVPRRLRRGTFATAPRESRWTQWSLWTAHAAGSCRPIASAAWALSRLALQRR